MTVHLRKGDLKQVTKTERDPAAIVRRNASRPSGTSDFGWWFNICEISWAEVS